jgi:protein gp37
MAENSFIGWTDHTFNPWIGCTKVSAACDFCYAEVWDARFKGDRWGPKADRKRTKTYGNPVKWNAEAQKKGIRYKVFCASLADIFDNHKSIQPQWRTDVWDLVEKTPFLDWQFLTKRPQNISKFVPKSWMEKGFPENVWVGTTVEDHTTAEQRIPSLLNVPARVRFLSCEPMIGSVDLTNVLGHNVLADLQWVIVGGESGPQFRPTHIQWVQKMRDDCQQAGVPFYFKQWGGTSQTHIKKLAKELDNVLHDAFPV